MTYYVYAIINRVTQWVYIGKTNAPSVRWRRHVRRTCNSHLRASMNVHGAENFDFVIVERHSSENEAYESEAFWIAYLRSLGAYLYNQNEGGRGGTKPTQEVRIKLANGRRGKKASLESRERMRQSQLGKKQTPERIAHRAEKITGMTRDFASRERSRHASRHRQKLTDEQRKSIGFSILSNSVLAAQYGVSHTLIQRIKQRYTELQTLYRRE